MIKEPTDQIFETLSALLDEERAVLLRGDLEAMSDLVTRKQALFDQLSSLKGQPDDALGDLRAKTLRNQALLDSALQGIRSVADRMESLRRVRDSLETYDSQGNRMSVPSPDSKRVERRA